MNALFRDTPLAYSFCTSGGQAAGGQVARWQVAGATKSPLVFYIVKWGGVLLPLKLKKNSTNKSSKLGDLSTKICGLSAKFENCIFKNNPNVTFTELL